MSYLREYVENWAPENLKTLYYRLEALIPIISTLEGRLSLKKATNSPIDEINAISEQLQRYRTEYTNVHTTIVKIKTKKKIYCSWEKTKK